MAATQQYGFITPVKPLRPLAAPSLAAAASKDPFGLAVQNGPQSGLFGVGSSSGFAAPVANKSSGYTQSQVDQSLAANPYASPGGYVGEPIKSQVPSAQTATSPYDVNTNPDLQQIRSLVGLSNEQAQSEALKERQNLVLAYGDKSVAQSVLGADDPIAAAAASNPTSTVAQLGQQRDQNMKSLLDALNPQNLAYSGYRVTQEQQAQNDYQNALAQAASGLNTSLDSVTGNLNSALSQNQSQLVNAISAAAAAHAGDTTDPGAGSSTPVIPPVTPPPGSDGSDGRDPNQFSAADLAAIMQAGRQRKTDQLTYNLGRGIG